MLVNVFIERSKERKAVTMKAGSRLSDLFAGLKINPETVIVSRAGQLLTASAGLMDSDEIKILSVVSGG
jgi:sulfur carrier protein ThiS